METPDIQSFQPFYYTITSYDATSRLRSIITLTTVLRIVTTIKIVYIVSSQHTNETLTTSTMAYTTLTIINKRERESERARERERERMSKVTDIDTGMYQRCHVKESSNTFTIGPITI